MASYTDAQYALYAGQAGKAQGIRSTPYASPVIDLGDPFNATALANLNKINGLMPKIGKTIFHETSVYSPDILKAFKSYSSPFGVAVEDAGFQYVGIDKKSDGTCVPRNTDVAVGQLSAINVGFNFTVNVYDREINGAALSDAEISAYVANKLKLIQAGYYDMIFNAAKFIVSDVVPGSRTISSYESSIGSGTASNVTTKPEGYCGVVKNHADWVIPEIGAVDTEPTLKNETAGETTYDMVHAFLAEVRNLAGAMKYPSVSMNKLSRKTFSMRKNVIMETNVLNAFDKVIADASDLYFEGKDARGFINGIDGVNLIEIDSFAALPAYDSTTYPTSTDYTGQRIGAVIADEDVFGLITNWMNTESQRCMGERMTATNMQGEQILRAWHGAPAACILVDHTADP